MKKAGLVISSTLMLAAGVFAPSALGSSNTAVRVQIRTLTKTLKTADVHGEKGWITKGRTPAGKCSASSAAGALNAATHGRWSGKYYSGVGIFITSILGVKPSGADYWGVYVNGRFSSKGVCDIKLRSGQRLLFQIKK